MTETLYPRLRLQQTPALPRVRIRMLPALLPLNVSMQATDTEIQYRIGDGPWMDLIALADFIPQYAVDVETGAGPFNVSATAAYFVLNKSVPSATSLILPTVASRQKLPLTIVDFGNNAGDITVTAAPGETIMGLASAVLSSNGGGPLGSGAATALFPSTDVAGWLAI